MRARLADGFQLASEDDEFDLRFHVLDQTDFKLFIPNDRTFGKSGLYIPRVRVYLEGRLTRFWEYEVSLQRSLDGTWDLLDGNLNLRLSEAFQVKFGRFLVPYSYDWFDHLEQYFIAPERALFPLNFGLSRQAGLMAWGRAGKAGSTVLGGFNGHLTGLADNNPNQEAVGYFNLRPFLGSDRFPPLRHLNVGASGAIGQVARTKPPCRCGPRCRPPRTTRPPPTPRPSSSTSMRARSTRATASLGGPPGLLLLRPLVRVGVEHRPVPDDPARPPEQARDPCAGLPHHARLLRDRRRNRAPDDRRAPAAVPPV